MLRRQLRSPSCRFRNTWALWEIVSCAFRFLGLSLLGGIKDEVLRKAVFGLLLRTPIVCAARGVPTTPNLFDGLIDPSPWRAISGEKLTFEKLTGGNLTGEALTGGKLTPRYRMRGKV